MSNTATVTTSTATATATTPTKSVKPDFGDGRYSAVMREAFADCLRLVSQDAIKAEAFARQLGADLGRAMAAVPVKVGYGKTNKDGRMTLKEAASVKGVTSTNALTLARLISMANDVNATKLARVDGITLVTGSHVAEWFEKL